ncbi:hypothetical protein BC939DRAFT_475838 [Gamsiella multidivaricata]|uniref:uncharacterized protein n=1 Tax=Gamsiella multidivaricata TaxID=101098 RepID=UPI00221E89FB|nr:uncharacterized protein BC939DRAFT_475838 [Gamsiella multidivaricata]KAI7826138.1 hypothetical protein BC939DRAFT_475838 [Gamsiella multidivaricata]
MSNLSNSQIFDVIEEDQSLVLFTRDSIAHWSVAVSEEDMDSLRTRSTPLPFLPEMDNLDHSSMRNPFEDDTASLDRKPPLVAASLFVMEDFASLPRDRQTELLSHADTREMHFGRLSRELHCGSIIEAGMESLKANPAFAHFFKPVSVPIGGSPRARRIAMDHGNGSDFDNDDLDDDDLDDVDYHYPRPNDLPTMTYIRRVGRQNEARFINYGVDEAPSSGCSASSVNTDLTCNDVSPAAPPTVIEPEERGELLRQAAEALDPRIFSYETYKTIREGLELGYDRTMTGKTSYANYIKERKACLLKMTAELENFESFEGCKTPYPRVSPDSPI